MPTPFSSLPGAATFSLRFPSRSKDFFLARPIFPIPGRPFLRLRPPSSGPGVRPQCRRQPGYEPGAPLFAAPRRQLSPHRDIFLTTPGPAARSPCPPPTSQSPRPFPASPAQSLPPSFSSPHIFPAPAHTLPRVQPGVFAPPRPRHPPSPHQSRPAAPGGLAASADSVYCIPINPFAGYSDAAKNTHRSRSSRSCRRRRSLCAGRHQQRHHRRQVQRLRRKQHRRTPRFRKSPRAYPLPQPRPRTRRQLLETPRRQPQLQLQPRLGHDFLPRPAHRQIQHQKLLRRRPQPHHEAQKAPHGISQRHPRQRGTSTRLRRPHSEHAPRPCASLPTTSASTAAACASFSPTAPPSCSPPSP